MLATTHKMRLRLLAFERAGLFRDATLGVLVVGLFFCGIGGFAGVVPLDAAVVASGTVIVAGRSEVVATSEGGLVAEVFVSEGDMVAQGQALMRLDAGQRAGEVSSLRARRIELEALRAQLVTDDSGGARINTPGEWDVADAAGGAAALARRQRELSSRQAALGDDLGVFDQRLAQIDAQIRGLRDQKAAVNEQMRLADLQIATLSGLAEKGLATLSRLREAERTRAQLSERSAGLDSDVAALSERIGETRLQKSRLSEETSLRNRSELAEVDRTLAELLPRLSSGEEALSRLVIRASTAGRVMNLAADNAGDVIRPGARILDIVPSQRELLIEANVDPRDADDLIPGQMSEVRFSGEKSRLAQSRTGEVVYVSPDRVFDEATRAAWFVVRVKVIDADPAGAATDRASTPAGFEVRPGYPAEVMIPLRKRTALQYLLEPLNQAMWRTMREH